MKVFIVAEQLCHQEILFAHSSICRKAKIQVYRQTGQLSIKPDLLPSDGTRPTAGCFLSSVTLQSALISKVYCKRSELRTLSTESREQAKGRVMLENLWRRWTSDPSLALIRGAWHRNEYRISSPITVSAVQSWVVSLLFVKCLILWHNVQYLPCKERAAHTGFDFPVKTTLIEAKATRGIVFVVF